jgi:hypothetical protein
MVVTCTLRNPISTHEYGHFDHEASADLAAPVVNHGPLLVADRLSITYVHAGADGLNQSIAYEFGTNKGSVARIVGSVDILHETEHVVHHEAHIGV